MLPILLRLINFCWSVVKWTLIVGVLGGAVAYVYVQQQLDEQIRLKIEGKIAQHYQSHGLTVAVGSAELVHGKGIAVRDVAIRDPRVTGPGGELLRVDEMLLSCTSDLQELIRQDPEISQVVLRRLTLRATRQPDGPWNSGRLLPLPKFSERSPTVLIESAAVEILDPTKAPAGAFHLRDINLTLWPPDPQTPPNTVPMQRVRGTLGGDFLHQVQFDGWIDPRQQLLDVGGTIEALEVCPELRTAMPGTVAQNWDALETLRAQVGANFRISYQPNAPVPLQFQVAGHLIRGRLDHPRLPHAVTDIQASFQVSNEGFQIDNLVAHSGSASLRLACRGAGFGPNRPLSLRADIEQLEVNDSLMDALPKELPEGLRRQWLKYHPAGAVNAHLELTYDGRTWTPSALLRCSDLSFLADIDRFPYRLEHARGGLELKDDQLTLNLTAYAGGEPVQLAANLGNLRGVPCGWVTAEGSKLALDERLFSALQPYPKACKLVRSLKPRGTIDLYTRFERTAPAEPWHRYLNLKLNQCGLCYEEFPYPLSNVNGRLEVQDSQWSFRDLSGANGTGVITCKGTMQTTPTSYSLSLDFTGKSVPLEGELRNALAARRPGLLDLWNRLKPQGSVDLSEVRVISSSEQPQPNISFCIKPCEDASIEPSAFPYRLDKVQGTIWYRDRQATWQQCRAEHGNTKVFSDGACELLADGGWHLNLNNLIAEHVQADRDMIQALPERLKRGILGLHPVGSCNLQGRFDLTSGGAVDAPLTSEWDINVDFQQALIDFGLKLENLCGSTRLWGSHNGQDYLCRGELRLDSLTYRDIQFTNVTGPLWFDSRQVLLGEWVDPNLPGNLTPNQPPRPLMADLFQGKAYTSARVVLGDLPQYEIHTQAEKVDLASATQETLAGRQQSQGKVWAWAKLQGTGRNLTDLTGHGQLTLREANIYELPMMIRMLKLLRVQQPDANAFSKCELSFGLQGPHIYLKPINFTGDAISLVGSGELDLQSKVHLTLGVRLGRPEERIPLITDLLGGASEQLLLIRVDGTLQDPAVTQVPLPGVDQALQQLQQDLQGSPPPQQGMGTRPAGPPKVSRRLPNSY